MPIDPSNVHPPLRELDAMLKDAKFTGRGIKRNARFFFTSKSQSLVPQHVLKKLDEAGKSTVHPPHILTTLERINVFHA